jgi:predicted transcriptional regulator
VGSVGPRRWEPVPTPKFEPKETTMKVSDILRVKGSTLFTVSPESLLAEAVTTMAEHDIGSLVVMTHGDLVGMLTFREVIRAVVRNGGEVGAWSATVARWAPPSSTRSWTTRH